MLALVLLSGLCALALAATALAQDEKAYNEAWYKVDSLNPELGPVPEGLRRDTPQETMVGFLDAAHDDDWQRAAHFLDLSEVTQENVPKVARQLARQLASVIDRKLWIDWNEISDRPDALVETGGRNSQRAGEPRKSQRLGILEADGRPVVLRLARVKPGDRPPVWVFSSRTVALVPALYERHGPGRLEQLLPDWWTLRVGESGPRRWELVALPMLLVLAGLVFMLCENLFGRLARMRGPGFFRRAAQAAKLPAALVATALFTLAVTSWAISFSGPVTVVGRPILIALLIIGVTTALLRAVDAVLDVITRRYVGNIDDEHSRSDRHFYTTIYAVRRVILILAVVLAVAFVFSQLHLTSTAGVSLLASAGVLTVVLGIAGQAVLGNILASLQIAFAKPIRIGDSVCYEDRWAYVEAIYFTYVCLRTWDQRRLIVPVRYFVSHPFQNWSMKDARMTWTFELRLDHAADVAALREQFMQIVQEDDDVLTEDMTKVMTTGHDHTGVLVGFYATADDPSAAWNMHARLREAMLAWIRDNHPEWWPRERVATRTEDREVAAEAADGAD